MTIYYCYELKTGRFAGSGISQIDDDEYSSTTVPCPSYDAKTQIPKWNNIEWTIEEK
jgi:hypothetical protein